MNDQSPKSHQKTSKASSNTISSQESGAGRWPLNSPDGRRMRQCVREVRRASLLVWLENEAGGTTPVTWLRPFSTSSQSCDLQLFLANRLAQQLKNCGSMLYSLSWKKKVTPAGRQYCQRAASAPRTKEIDFSLVLTGWLTPTVTSMEGRSEEAMERRKAQRLATGRTSLAPGNLAEMVQMYAAWPTSSATDWKGGYAGGRIRNGKLSVDRLDVAAQLATYPTPLTVPDSPESRGQLSGSYRKGMEKCTPAPDFPIRITARGQMLTGCYAGMGSSGPLDPAFSRWLMGYPPEWCDCADTAMQSSLKSAPSSSETLWWEL